MILSADWMRARVSLSLLVNQWTRRLLTTRRMKRRSNTVLMVAMLSDGAPWHSTTAAFALPSRDAGLPWPLAICHCRQRLLLPPGLFQCPGGDLHFLSGDCSVKTECHRIVRLRRCILGQPVLPGSCPATTAAPLCNQAIAADNTPSGLRSSAGVALANLSHTASSSRQASATFPATITTSGFLVYDHSDGPYNTVPSASAACTRRLF